MFLTNEVWISVTDTRGVPSCTTQHPTIPWSFPLLPPPLPSHPQISLSASHRVASLSSPKTWCQPTPWPQKSVPLPKRNDYWQFLGEQVSPNHTPGRIQQRRPWVRKQGKSGALEARVESHASVTDTGPECDRNSWGKCSQSLGKRKAERSSVSQSAKDVFRELSKDSGHLSVLFPHLQNVILRIDWILILTSLMKIPRMKQTK